MSEFDEELNEFLQEAEETFQKIEEALLELEKGTEDVSLIDEAMRHLHSMKGVSGYFSLRFTEAICHVCEDVLSTAKRKEIFPDAEIVSALLAAVDGLRASVEHLKPGGTDALAIDHEKYASLLMRLTTFDLLARDHQTWRAQDKSTSTPKQEESNKNTAKTVIADEEVSTSSAKHTDKPVYALPFMRLGQRGISAADSWLLTSLLRMKYQRDNAEGESLAARMLSILKSSETFKWLDRICLARVHAFSNLIEIISAGQSSDVQSPNMVPGYRCFVSPNSSLFQIDPGQVRIFSDIEQVLESYEAEGKPVQRSIRLIAEGGFKSGICVPIYLGAKVRGFLFFNSREKHYFDQLSDSQTLIISTAATILESFAIEHFIPEYNIANYSEQGEYRGVTRSFDTDLMMRETSKRLRELLASPPRLSIKGEKLSRFLISYSALRAALCEILAILAGAAGDQGLKEITIDVTQSANQLDLHFGKEVASILCDDELNAADAARSNSVRRVVASLGFKMKLAEEEFVVSIPAEEADAGSQVLYSV